MEMSTPQKLQIYINAELGDAALYRKLANMAPYLGYRDLLNDMAEDEQTHADDFKAIYKTLTGKSYNPPIPVPELNGTFEEILRDRVLDESGDYRKYGNQYIITENNSALKTAYYKARTDENLHALHLLYMLNKLP